MNLTPSWFNMEKIKLDSHDSGRGEAGPAPSHRRNLKCTLVPAHMVTAQLELTTPLGIGMSVELSEFDLECDRHAGSIFKEVLRTDKLEISLIQRESRPSDQECSTLYHVKQILISLVYQEKPAAQLASTRFIFADHTVSYVQRHQPLDNLFQYQKLGGFGFCMYTCFTSLIVG